MTKKTETASVSKTVTAAFAKIDAAIKASHTTCLATGKAEGTEYTAMIAMLKACKLVMNDLQNVSEIRKRINEAFIDSIAGGEIRCTIATNVSKVAYGGVVGSKSKGTKKKVAGKGWDVVERIMSECTTIYTFRDAIAQAKPEGLKKKTPPKPPEGDSKPLEDAVLTRADAMNAVLEVLKISMTVFRAGTDSRIIDNAASLEKLIKAQIEADLKEAA